MNSASFELARGPLNDVSLLARRVQHSWRTGRRPVAALLATCFVAGCTMAERARAFRPLLDHFGVERAGMPLAAAIVRLPLSVAVSSPDLPAWGAALQVLGAVALGELLFGWRKTVAVGLITHAVATLSVRVMIAVGSGPLSLPGRYLWVSDTGPSAAVVGILAYVAVRCRARWALAAMVGFMLAEVVAFPNLAGHEHIYAIVVGGLIALAEKAVRASRAGSGRVDVDSTDVPVNGGAPRKRTTPEDRRRTFTTARRLALLTAGIGIVTLVSALVPASHGRLRLVLKVLPDAAPPGAAAASAVAGVLLLLLARGLAGRKRRAWQGTVVLLAVSAVLHIVKGFDFEEAAACCVVLGLLTARRDAFKALPDPRSRSVSVVALAGLLFFDLTVGIVLVASDTMHRVGSERFRDVVLTVVRGMVGVSGPVALTGQRGDAIADTLVAFSVLTVAVVSWLALRPAREAPTMSADDIARMRSLVAEAGDSLAYFALRPDKSVIWSPTGKAAIAYRVVGGVMLASGDPLGDKEAWPGAINAFLERADRHGWIPAALACGEVAAKAWARAGLAPFELGDEGIVDVESFRLDGRSMRNVRQTVTRIQRLGYTTSVVRTGDLTETRRQELGQQAAAWRGEVTERGFSMALGRVAGTSDPDAVLVVAQDAHDGIRGLLQFVPWGTTGWSLDVMRRDPAAANGVNELMITAALEHAADLGVRNISLNFAVFRSTLERGERLGAGFFSVWLLRLLMAASRWWQIESLYRFNAKFHPRWYTRYLCYPTLADLPRVVGATLRAEAFVRPPRRLAAAMRQGSS